MAIFYNCSQGWLLEKGLYPTVINVGIALILYSISILLWKKAIIDSNVLLFFSFIIIGITAVMWLFMHEKVASDGWSFFFGWRGERKVGKALRLLNNEYHVFYDVKFNDNRGNIDYVVVSTKGIFAVEVKNHSKSVTENEARNKSEELRAIKESLQIYDEFFKTGTDTHLIFSVLVRADKEHFLKTKNSVTGTDVLGIKDIPTYFNDLVAQKYEKRLSLDEINKIVKVFCANKKCRL